MRDYYTETASPPLTVEQTVIEKAVQKLMNLSGLERESAFKEITRRVKVTIVGKEYDMKQLILNSIAVKAAPIIHAVIADEVIRLSVGRKEYVKVVVPLFNRIRDAIGWTDHPGAVFCPKWTAMKILVHKEMDKGPNKAIHVKKPDWRAGDTGCVWTEVDLYLAERLITYRETLPATYNAHLKTIARRVELIEQLLPGLYA